MGRSGGEQERGPLFVGRSREIAVLDAELERAAGGNPRVVLVEGTEGIGKTALVQRWLATGPICRPVVVSADEGEAHLAYAVVGQLVTRLGAPAGALGGREALLVGADLVQVLGTASTGAGPLVVVLDDAHWSDPPSSQALAFALRRLVAEPVFTVVLTRDAALLPEGLVRICDGNGGGRRVRLEGLSAEDLVELGGRLRREPLDRTVGERVREHTDGNPLHAEALFRELDADALRAPTGPLPAPRSFGLLVANRLRACSPDAARLVGASAVLGQRCPLRIATRLGGIDDAVTALQDAVDAGLLEAVGTPPGALVAFPHALVRAAVYHDLGPAKRSALHLRAAELVDSPGALDHRIAASLVEDDALAGEVAALARQEAADRSVTAAAFHLVAAARLSTGRHEREALAIEALTLLLRAGQVGSAAALHEAASFAPSAQRSFVLGLLALFDGRQNDAERLLAEAWERGKDDDAAMAAEAAAYLAQLCSIQVRSDDTIRWAQRALAASANPRLVPAFSVLVCQLWFVGRRDEAIDHLGGMPPPGVPSAETDPELLLVRGLLRMWSDDREGARADLGASVAAHRPILTSRSGLIALSYLAEADFRCGAWDDSTAHAALAVSLADATDQTWMGAFVHSSRSEYCGVTPGGPATIRRSGAGTSRARRRGGPHAGVGSCPSRSARR